MKVFLMKFNTEAERMQHPFAAFIPASIWSALFNQQLSVFQLLCAEKTSTKWILDLEQTQKRLNQDPQLNQEDTLNAWLMVALTHPELADDALMKLANYFDLSPHHAFWVTISLGRTTLFELFANLYPERLKSVIEEKNYFAFRLAAEHGHVGIMARLCELMPNKIQNMVMTNHYDAFHRAAGQGQLHVIDYLIEHHPEHADSMLLANKYQTFYAAVKNGQWEVLQRLTASLPPNKLKTILAHDSYRLLTDAAEWGQLTMLRHFIAYLQQDQSVLGEYYQFRSQTDENAFYYASIYGHVDIMAYLISLPRYADTFSITTYSKALAFAVSGGHWNAVEYIQAIVRTDLVDALFSNDHYAVFSNYSASGNLDQMARFMSRVPTEQVPIMLEKHHAHAFVNAAKHGHLAMLSYLIELAPDAQLLIEYEGYQPFVCAAEQGQLDVMKYLMTCVPQTKQLSMMESNNAYAYDEISQHIDLNPHLIPRMQKIPKDAFAAFTYAANCRHLEMMTYCVAWVLEHAPDKLEAMLVANNYLAFEGAVEHDDMDVVEALVTLMRRYAPHKLEDMLTSSRALTQAATYGHFTLLKYLLEVHEQHELIATCDYKFVLDVASRHGYIESMIRAPEHIVPPDYLIRDSVRSGHLEMVTFLAAKLSDDAFRGILSHGNFESCHAVAKKGHLGLFNYIFERTPDVITSNSWELFELAAKDEHIDIMDRLVELDTDQRLQNRMISQYRFLSNALEYSSTFKINALLRYPVVLDYVERHRYEYNSHLNKFTLEQFRELRARQADFEEEHPQAVFDVSTESEARRYFYLLRQFIRNHNEASLENIHFLMTLPSVHALLHVAVTPSQPNELLRLALTEGNQEVALILLNVSAVRALAAEHNFYIDEQRGALDLAALARDRESSLTGLTQGEQKRLRRAQDHYKSVLEEQGVTALMERLRHTLQVRYEAHPATVLTGDGRVIDLPATWDAWCVLRKTLSEDTRERALESYIKHKDHSAWRYLEKPNPWMADTASYVIRDEQGAYSTFEDYQPLIALFFLGATDENTPPSDGHTLATRLEHFIDELAHIGRAHNWDRTRSVTTVNGEEISEEYDDLEGDKPSCYSGVKRRLFQSVLGHPYFKILTLDDIKQELRDFVRTHFETCIRENPPKAIAWCREWTKLCEDGVGGEALSELNITPEEQDTFIQELNLKYAKQFEEDAIFALYIQNRFKLSDVITTHAACFGGEVDLTYLLIKPYPARVLNIEELRAARVRKFSVLQPEPDGVHPDVVIEIEVITLKLAALKFPIVVKEEAKNYLADKANPATFSEFNQFTHQIKQIEEEGVDVIWGSIKDHVAARMFDEFGSLYVNQDDPRFTAFMDTAQYIELGELPSFQKELSESEGYRKYCSSMMRSPGLFFGEKTQGQDSGSSPSDKETGAQVVASY